MVEEGVRWVKNLLFSHHARDRMDERGITQGQVYAALASPDDNRPSPKGPRGAAGSSRRSAWRRGRPSG